MFVDCEICDEEMYFFTEMESAFCKMNLHTFEVSYVQSFDGQLGEIREHRSNMIQKVENKLYSLDIGGRYLLEYDWIKDTYKYIEIGCDYEGFDNFLSLHKFKNTIIAVTKKQNILVRLDCETGVVCKKQIVENKADCMPLVCSAQIGEDIFLFQENSSEIIVYHVETDNTSVIVLQDEKIEYKDVRCFKNNLYILGKNNGIFMLDRHSDSIVPIRTEQPDEKDGEMLFVTDDCMWILPARGNDIVRYDIEERKVDVYNEYPHDFIYYVPSGWRKYTCYCESEVAFFLAMRSSNYMLSISKTDGGISWIKPQLPSESLRLQRDMLNGNKILQEERYSLSFYVESVCKGIL